MTNSARRRPSIEAQTFLIIDLGFAVAIVISVFLVIFGPGLARAVFTGSPITLTANAELGVTAVAVAAVLGAATIVTLVLINTLVVKRLKREIEVRAAELSAQQSALASQLRDAAAQEERNRLARDLHDTIKQQLFSINVAAATAQSLRERDPSAAALHIQEIRDLSQAAMVEMKALLTQLRPHPLAAVGLLGAIQEQLDALKFRADMQVELHSDPLPDESRLPVGAQEAIFRVTQEALANVARHARARRATVSLGICPQDADRLCVSVADDGQGFSTAELKAGMGMSNMRARVEEMGGELQVQSTPGSGTTIAFNVPLIRPQQIREAAQREKEDRFQVIYWAASLLSIATTLILIGTVAAAAYLPDAVAGAPNGWPVVLFIVGISAAIGIPIFVGGLGFRQRALAFSPPGSAWLDLIRNFDAQLIAYLAAFAAWICLTLRWFLPAAALAAVAIGAGIVIVRLGRRLNERVQDWGTQSMFRTRLREATAFLALGALIVGLTFAGLFGDPGSVRLFHESIDAIWVTSTFTIAYPILVLCFIPTAWLGWRQLQRLRELEGDDAADSPARPASERTQVLRWAARALTAAFVLASVPLMAALVGPAASPSRSLVIITALALLLVAKWRVERALTARCAEWTTRPAQRSAAAIYGFFFFTAALGLGGGIAGALVAFLTPESPPRSTNELALPIEAVLALASIIITLPVYLGLMTWVARSRAKLLGAIEPGDEPNETLTRAR